MTARGDAYDIAQEMMAAAKEMAKQMQDQGTSQHDMTAMAKGMIMKRKVFKAWLQNLSQSRLAVRAYTDHELSMFGELRNT